jgi:hypothetical protein
VVHLLLRSLAIICPFDLYPHISLTIEARYT